MARDDMITRYGKGMFVSFFWDVFGIRFGSSPVQSLHPDLSGSPPRGSVAIGAFVRGLPL